MQDGINNSTSSAMHESSSSSMNDSSSMRDAVASQAQHLAARAQDSARAAASKGTKTAADTLWGLAQSLKSAGQELEAGQNMASGVVCQVASRIETFAQNIEQTSPDQMLRQAQSWARSNPALFVGCAFGVGLLAARFLKASSPEIGQSSSSRMSFSDREVPTPHSVEVP